MDREQFTARLREAATAARDFARSMIEEDLPDALRFRVRLNSSYDAHAGIDVAVYPEDSSEARASALRDCDDEVVVNTLWRDGRIPEWIDASVAGLTPSATLVELLCCGRFTDKDEHLYHQHEGRPPFHVVGPAFPVRFGLDAPRERFSIFDRSECWTRDDVLLLAPHAKKVTFLDLVGSSFGDDALEALPTFPQLTVLVLKRTAVTDTALELLSRHPNLTYLTVEFGDDCGRRKVRRIPSWIKTLTLRNLPGVDWSSADLLPRLADLGELSLQSSDVLRVDGACPAKLTRLSITAKELIGSFKLPRSVGSLSLHLHGASDENIDAFLGTLEDCEALDLSETPVGDALAERLPRRYRLRYLNLVRTRVTEEAMHRIASTNPTLKLLPNLGAK